MPEPTNGELAIMLGGISDKFDTFVDQNGVEHGRIEEQVLKTNGSVADAKRDIADLNKWRYMAVGGIGILSVMVVPLFVSFMKDYMSK